MRSEFRIYDSVGEFLTASMNVPPEYNRYMFNNMDEFKSVDDAKEYVRRGATEDECRLARELVDKIDTEVHGLHALQWSPQVYGAYPCVPDYLNGQPTSMRAREEQAVDVAPVRVVVNSAVSAGMLANVVAKRVAAIAAFALKLSERVPVELWWATANHNSHERCDVGLRVKMDMPCNLPQIVAMFSRKVTRGLGVLYKDCQATRNSGRYTCDGYPFELNNCAAQRQRNAFVAAFRRYMHLDPDDIVLDAGILTDCSLIDSNPVQWVKDMLAKYGEATED